MSSSFRRYMCAGLVLLAVSSAALAAKEDKKKKDAPPEPPKAAVAEPGLVAIVGDMKVTDQDLVSSLPPNSQKGLQAAEQNIKTIERTAMQEQFAKRYIADQAAKTGMSEDDFVAKEIAANRDSFSPEYRAQISQAKQQIYDGKRQALDDLIGKKLEENAAKAKGVSVDAYVKTEVEDKVDPVTPADVDNFYTQNQRQFGSKSKDEVAPQINDMIKRNRVAQKRNELRASLRAATTVRTLLEVPRMQVSPGDSQPRGPKDAPVQLILFSDFQCPFCSRVETTLKQVKDRYGDKIAIYFRDYPLPFHQYAAKAAEAAACAGKMGKYWEYHDALFANQQALDVPSLKKTAETLGLDGNAFGQCLDSGEMKAKVDKDQQAGQGYGVSGTPASFINGRLVPGAQPFEGFQRVIDDELQTKGIAIPAAPAAGAPGK